MSEKLSCSTVRDLLPMYIENLLSPETEEAVKAHLEECEECRTIYEQMTGPQPAIPAENPEVDYLKKINQKRSRMFIILGLLAALLVGSVFAWYRSSQQPVINYDESSRTMTVSGVKDLGKLRLPDSISQAENLDVQTETFQMNVHLQVLRNEDVELKKYIPEYLSRTEKSLQFLRIYFRENCPEVYLGEQADKFVELDISPTGSISWRNRDDRIIIETDNYYWHREELYILALMDSKIVQWKQLGYAWYVGTCIDPYSETLYLGMGNIQYQKYWDTYLKAGGTQEATPENFRILNDAVSYICLTYGMNWGTAYESMPLNRTLLYNVPKIADTTGDNMSVCMATSFIAYLSDQYGFDHVSSFCYGKESFEKAFGSDFETEYGKWSSHILEVYG